MKPFLDQIDHTLLTEGALWCSDFYAGACDCIGYMRGAESEPVLIDFKTANKQIGGTKLYDYEMQVAAYIKAANYVYRKEGLVIRKGIIACAVPDYSVQIFELERDDINQLYAHFIEKLEDWHEKHVIPQTLKINCD